MRHLTVIPFLKMRALIPAPWQPHCWHLLSAFCVFGYNGQCTKTSSNSSKLKWKEKESITRRTIKLFKVVWLYNHKIVIKTQPMSSVLNPGKARPGRYSTQLWKWVTFAGAFLYYEKELILWKSFLDPCKKSWIGFLT